MIVEESIYIGYRVYVCTSVCVSVRMPVSVCPHVFSLALKDALGRDRMWCIVSSLQLCCGALDKAGVETD